MRVKLNKTSMKSVLFGLQTIKLVDGSITPPIGSSEFVIQEGKKKKKYFPASITERDLHTGIKILEIAGTENTEPSQRLHFRLYYLSKQFSSLHFEFSGYQGRYLYTLTAVSRSVEGFAR